MSTVSVKDDKVISWSDPFIGRQIDEFQAFVKKRSAEGVSAPEVVETAEHLCEWSRTLFNRTFGRTTREELDHITILFRETAEQILKWAESVTKHDQLKQIRAYAAHIQQRTGLIKL